MPIPLLPQGDGISALFFIIYLAISLSKHNDTNQASGCEDHTYAKKPPSGFKPEDHTPFHPLFLLDQQYADDIGWAATQKGIIDHIENEVPKILSDRNLQINASKTERYTISRLGNQDWRQCKYIGSLLGTEEDIDRRKKLTNFAYQSIRNIFNRKRVTENTKLRIFVHSLRVFFCIIVNSGALPNILMIRLINFKGNSSEQFST